MNWERIEGNWSHFKALVKHRWSKLDDVFLDASAGRRDQLVDRIQEEYGVTRSESEEQLAAWLDAQD